MKVRFMIYNLLGYIVFIPINDTGYIVIFKFKSKEIVIYRTEFFDLCRKKLPVKLVDKHVSIIISTILPVYGFSERNYSYSFEHVPSIGKGPDLRYLYSLGMNMLKGEV